MDTSAFWFRRDLRIEDNTGLREATQSGHIILLVFIFDDNIIDELPSNDPRLNFIHQSLETINNQLLKHNGALLVLKGNPIEIWKKLIKNYNLRAIYANQDYEPYAIQRDKELEKLCRSNSIEFKSFKDQVIFEKDEVLKADGNPYTVFTPYKNKWLEHFETINLQSSNLSSIDSASFFKPQKKFPGKQELGIKANTVLPKSYKLKTILNYDKHRNFPSKDAGSYLGPYLRFGRISIRKLVQKAINENQTFLSELIWREFFMQILYHFPKVINNAFKTKYDNIKWKNDTEQFEKWCNGKTGYPMVDAGMRQLNQTGYMHNRVRMITASFLVKHLLIDWRWGEAYFAKKLLDFELSSNNGNWQWAAGTGCDAAPYFRIFNPSEQQKKFDPKFEYIKKWVPEFGTDKYPGPIIEHRFARKRALETYKKAIN